MRKLFGTSFKVNEWKRRNSNPHLFRQIIDEEKSTLGKRKEDSHETYYNSNHTYYTHHRNGI
jgi:hypothetical protein